MNKSYFLMAVAMGAAVCLGGFLIGLVCGPEEGVGFIAVTFGITVIAVVIQKLTTINNSLQHVKFKEPRDE